MGLDGTSESSITDANERAGVRFMTLESRIGLADKIRRVLSIVGVAGSRVVAVGNVAGSRRYIHMYSARGYLQEYHACICAHGFPPCPTPVSLGARLAAFLLQV